MTILMPNLSGLFQRQSVPASKPKVLTIKIQKINWSADC